MRRFKDRCRVSQLSDQRDWNLLKNSSPCQLLYIRVSGIVGTFFHFFHSAAMNSSATHFLLYMSSFKATLAKPDRLLDIFNKKENVYHAQKRNERNFREITLARENLHRNRTIKLDE